jgi:hypothetical protein
MRIALRRSARRRESWQTAGLLRNAKYAIARRRLIQIKSCTERLPDRPTNVRTDQRIAIMDGNSDAEQSLFVLAPRTAYRARFWR